MSLDVQGVNVYLVMGRMNERGDIGRDGSIVKGHWRIRDYLFKESQGKRGIILQIIPSKGAIIFFFLGGGINQEIMLFSPQVD